MPELNAIRETSYLTADQAERYRRIMRVFYDAYERMRFQLYKEEVYERLQNTYPELSDLTMDQLKVYLSQLTDWKNLVAIQDPKKVYTIAEYKNKQFRYSMSDAAVEIERMTVRLENMLLEPASLSSNYFLRIERDLQALGTLNRKDLKKVNEWWKELQEDFRFLNQNYQDYLREFYTGKSEKILKSLEFVIHKERFISYLQEFIQELTHYSGRIAHLLEEIKEPEALLEQVTASELAIPRPDTELREGFEKNLRDSIYGKWASLEQWFLERYGNPSESSRILDITNEVIQKIIQNATLIVQLQNWGISRRSEYARWIRLFHDCESLEEAHRLSACLFGAMNTRHFSVNAPRETDSIFSAVSEEEPFVFPLVSRSRSYRPRSERSGYLINDLEKNARREEYLRLLEENRKIAVRYIKDRKIDVSSIQDTVPVSLRTMILSWITLANMNSSSSGRTEYGWAYTVHKEEGSCVLDCEDGALTMPCYVIEFEEDIAP